MGQDICQSHNFIPILVHQVENEVIFAEFPHHLAAYTAGRKLAFDDPILAAADGDSLEIPMTVIDRFEECGALGADGGGKGCVLNIAALIHSAIGT